MRLMPSVLAASLLISLTAPAWAGGPPGTVGPEMPELAAPTHVKRYGKQILLADLVWLGAGTLIASQADGGDNIGSLLYLGYFATGPLIHLKHGNGLGAAKSLAARALLPVAGMLVGGMLAASSTENDPNEYDGDEDGMAVFGGMLLGGVVGVASAMVLDWTTFSKKTVEGRKPGWAVMPNVKVTRQSALAGVSGAF